MTDSSRFRHSFRIRKFIVAVAVIGLVAMVIAMTVGACSSSSQNGSDAKKVTKVSVMLDWTPNTNHSGMYLAKAKGWYRDAGLDVTFLQPGAGADVQQIVAKGTADFGVSVSEQVVPARSQHLPIVSIAAIIQHNTSSLISLKSSGITRPRDLEGHTYAAFGGPFEKALIDKLVTCDGGDASSIKFVEVGNADFRDGLTRHQYDFVWVYDGWDVIRIQDIDKLPLNRIPFIDHTSCIPDWYTPTLITSEKLISKNPDLVRRFMSATARGYREAMAHPDEAANTLLAAAPELDRTLVTKSARYLSTKYADDPATWGHQDPKVWSTFVDFLTENHIIKPGFATKDAYTNAFLPKPGSP